MEENNGYGFFKLFSSYFWLGIVLVLLSIIISLTNPSMPIWVNVLTRMLESIGIAILVASIFTYASGTSQFVNRINKLLQDIVVSRKFLGNIDAESKRDALSALIKPTTEEKKVYSNIEDYLNTYIKQTMDVTNKCVRSNYCVNARAYLENDKVLVDSNISYRLYPTKNGYSDIKVGFSADEEDSSCKKVVINTPHGKREIFKDLEFKEETIDAGKIKSITIDLSKYDKDCSHLDVLIDITESGADHWIMLAFSALIPTDGFMHRLHCEDGLVINQHQAFIYGAKFYIDKPSDKEMTTSCNEWINEGTGVSVLISLQQ